MNRVNTGRALRVWAAILGSWVALACLCLMTMGGGS